jgi:hypothetical protein
MRLIISAWVINFTLSSFDVMKQILCAGDHQANARDAARSCEEEPT